MEQTFGMRLTALRVRCKLTQDDLAEKAGISRPHISLLENGKKPAPQRATIHKLASALGVTEQELMPTSASMALAATDEAEAATDLRERVEQLERDLARERAWTKELWQENQQLKGKQVGKTSASSDAADTQPSIMWIEKAA